MSSIVEAREVHQHRYTILVCRAAHPVPGVGRRREHGARLGVLPGRWIPTGRLVRGPEGRGAIPQDERHAWAWCARCRVATEYERCQEDDRAS